MLAWLKQCFCNELTVHKASSFKTIPPRIDYETPSEAAICLHEAGHSTAALMVGLAEELMERPLVAKRTFTEKQTSEKRQQEILLGCREDALPANGAPGSQLRCADWRAQGLRQRR
jgi:hypothetical protein